MRSWFYKLINLSFQYCIFDMEKLGSSRFTRNSAVVSAFLDNLEEIHSYIFIGLRSSATHVFFYKQNRYNFFMNYKNDLLKIKNMFIFQNQDKLYKRYNSIHTHTHTHIYIWCLLSREKYVL